MLLRSVVLQFRSHLGLSLTIQRENPTLLNNETSLKIIESQTQQDLLYLELLNRVEEVNKKRELKVVLEFMANLSGDVDATPNEEVVDGVPMGHKAKQI